MVNPNPNSLVFKYSEKIGFLIGKCIRYIVVGGIIFFIGGKLSNSMSPVATPSQPGPSQAGPPGPE